jgi:phage terminase large subunit-like protein
MIHSPKPMSSQPDAEPPELEAFARFCGALVLEDGSRMSLEPFQRRMLRDFFGGTVETLILLPKKNGKSTLLGALGLFHLVTTPDAECVIGAASRDQATILYDQAAGFVRRSAGLEQRVHVKRGYREIQARRDSGRIRVLAADVDTADGVIPTLALVDELHRHKSAGLYGIFRDGLGPRRGRMITISTAGDSETSPLGLMRAKAHRLTDRERVERYLRARSDDGGYAMHEWALDRDDNTDDLDVVKLVNPASWQTPAMLRQRHASPSMLAWQWARFACGLWTASETWWITGEQWHAVARRSERIMPGDRICVGFDGSRSGDATALVACRLSDGLVQPLAVWEAPEGSGASAWRVHSSTVDAAIARTFEHYDVVRGYFDPPLWQSELEAWAREYGQPAVTPFSTNTSRMIHAVERFRTDVVEGTALHSGDAVLSAHVMNARMREVRGGYWLMKDRQASKIDAAIASVLAYEARADAIADGALDVKRKRVMSF